MVDLKLIKPKTIKLIATANIPDVSNDYNIIRNKPSINGVELKGNKTGKDLKLIDETTYNSDLYKINNKINDTNKNVNNVENELNTKIETINNNLENKQDKLTPGENITIENNIINANVPIFVWDGVGFNQQTPETDKNKIMFNQIVNLLKQGKYFILLLDLSKRSPNYLSEDNRCISFVTLTFSNVLSKINTGNFRINLHMAYVRTTSGVGYVGNRNSSIQMLQSSVLNLTNGELITLNSLDVTNYTGGNENIYILGNYTTSDRGKTQVMGISTNNYDEYTPTADYRPATKLYTDKTHYENMAGYDATKTQVLKNINGTLTWVSEE